MNLFWSRTLKRETNKQTKYLHQSTVVGNLKEKIFKKKIYNKDKYLATFTLKEFFLPLSEKNYIKILFTIVKYSLLYFKAMVLWKNYGTSIHEGEKHRRIPNTMILLFIMTKRRNMQNI